MRFACAILVSLAIIAGSVHGQGPAATEARAKSLLKDPAAREAAIRGLSLFEDSTTVSAILGNYPAFDATSRLAAVNALSLRTSNAMALMAAVKEGKVPSADLVAEAICQLRNLGEPEIQAWVDQTWAVARSTPASKRKEIKTYRAMLGAQAISKSNPGMGRALFVKTCQQCHALYGVGGKVGPDLTTTSRADLDYLLVNIIDPSSVIARNYQVSNIWTNDDEILSGIMSKEDDSSVTIVSDTHSTTVQKAQVQTVKKSEVSMMPEGQLLPLSQQEVINLVGYLRGSAQVDLPPGAASQPTVQKLAAAQPGAQKAGAQPAAPSQGQADRTPEPQAPS